ncbi:C39 family peptidase [Helicobacter turcicus]|uniref:Peptidase C39 n=1 Tax=Helicobacter turcicus TaxID=2867412 RepID=A0ABS7JNT0_9HELI|nr:cysteine peptidase family C39 domain-containing protein [Helicobacter turcicus]MBX7491033.1 peptidase C39 [Helicobacter turcicus]MBX7546294.1 peptidase C39 [Helicobacter turcicus]
MNKAIFIVLCSINFCFSFSVKSLQELHNQNVIRQQYEESCGASALATLLNLFTFKQYAEQDILNLLNQKTDMLSFKELQQTANTLGYRTKGFQLKREVLEQTSYPLLVRIENDPRFPHFVVIINYQGDFIKVLDPNFGEYIATKKEFYSIWDRNHEGGFALIITDKENSKPSIKDLEFPSERFLNRFSLF